MSRMDTDRLETHSTVRKHCMHLHLRNLDTEPLMKSFSRVFFPTLTRMKGRDIRIKLMLRASSNSTLFTEQTDKRGDSITLPATAQISRHICSVQQNMRQKVKAALDNRPVSQQNGEVTEKRREGSALKQSRTATGWESILCGACAECDTTECKKIK